MNSEAPRTTRGRLTHLASAGAAAVLALVLAAMLVAEATMQPSGRDRWVLLGVFAGSAAVALAVALGVGRATRRFTSVRAAVTAVGLAAVGAATLAVLASAQTMFLSTHDLRLVLVSLGLGAGLGAVTAVTVTGPLADDVAAIADATARIAAGEHGVRTGVARPDEVGALARSLDRMSDRLDAAEDDRRRMEATRRGFLAAVSHDLRTPLTSLRSALELLRDGLADDPDRYLGAMQADVVLLSSLVDDLFLLATIESGGLTLTLEPVDVAELCDAAVDATRAAAQLRSIDVGLEVGAGAPTEAAPREVQRIVRNLLDNAVRHAPDGGHVRVAVHAADGRVEVEVSDDGPGFSADFLQRAFDGFTRADEARTRAGGGAGLGLAIARGLAQAHGGDISAMPGPGGRVTFWLPDRRRPVGHLG